MTAPVPDLADGRARRRMAVSMDNLLDNLYSVNGADPGAVLHAAALWRDMCDWADGTLDLTGRASDPAVAGQDLAALADAVRRTGGFWYGAPYLVLDDGLRRARTAQEPDALLWLTAGRMAGLTGRALRPA